MVRVPFPISSLDISGTGEVEDCVWCILNCEYRDFQISKKGIYTGTCSKSRIVCILRPSFYPQAGVDLSLPS